MQQMLVATTPLPIIILDFPSMSMATCTTTPSLMPPPTITSNYELNEKNL
jgi:hypothetical protein